MKAFYFVGLMATVAVPIHAQQTSAATKWADSARVMIDASVLSESQSGLEAAGVLLDRALTVAPADYLLEHYKGYLLYLQGTVSLEKNQRPTALRQFQEADSLLAASMAQTPIAETFALRSAIAGRLAGLDPSAGASAKRTAGQMQARAEQAGPSNPRVALMRGLSALNGPPEYTGGVREAAKQFERARDLFTNDAPPHPLPTWGRPQVFAYLAVARHRMGDDAGALEAAREALRLAPGYRYVSDVILPMLGAKP